MITNENLEIITLMASVSSMIEEDAIEAHMYPRLRQVMTRVMSCPTVRLIGLHNPPNAVVLTAILDRFDQLIPA